MRRGGGGIKPCPSLLSAVLLPRGRERERFEYMRERRREIGPIAITISSPAAFLSAAKSSDLGTLGVVLLLVVVGGGQLLT